MTLHVKEAIVPLWEADLSCLFGLSFKELTIQPTNHSTIVCKSLSVEYFPRNSFCKLSLIILSLLVSLDDVLLFAVLLFTVGDVQ